MSEHDGGQAATSTSPAGRREPGPAQLVRLRSEIDALRAQRTDLPAEDGPPHESEAEQLQVALVELETAYEELRAADEEIRNQREQIDLLVRGQGADRLLRERLLGVLPVPMLLTDRGGLVNEANPQAMGLLGRRPSSVLGRSLATLVEPGDRPTIDAVLADPDSGPGELRIGLVRAGGPLPVRALPSVDHASDEVRWLLVPAADDPRSAAGGSERSSDVPTSQVLAELCRLAFTERELQPLLTGAARLVRRALPEATAVSVTLGSPREPEVTGSDSQLAQTLDAAQLHAGEGPCVEAYERGEVVRTDDVAADPRWPVLGGRCGGLGVGPALGLPVSVGRQPLGVLNVYLPRGSTAGYEALTVAGLFADTLAVTVDELQHVTSLRRLAQQLDAALESRGVIERARGVVMAHLGLSEDEAFAVLSRASQRSNRKLRVLAQQLVEATSRGVDVTRVLDA